MSVVLIGVHMQPEVLKKMGQYTHIDRNLEKLEESIENLEKDFSSKRITRLQKKSSAERIVSKKSDVTVSPTLGNCVPKFLAEDQVNESVGKQKCG